MVQLQWMRKSSKILFEWFENIHISLEYNAFKAIVFKAYKYKEQREKKEQQRSSSRNREREENNKDLE